jgi:hypothetical protein
MSLVGGSPAFSKPTRYMLEGITLIWDAVAVVMLEAGAMMT